MICEEVPFHIRCGVVLTALRACQQSSLLGKNVMPLSSTFTGTTKGKNVGGGAHRKFWLLFCSYLVGVHPLRTHVPF